MSFNTRTVASASIVLTSLLYCANVAAQASYVAPANSTVALNICDPVAETDPVYFHYLMGTTAYTAKVNGTTYSFAAPNNGKDTADLPLGQSCQAFTIVTSGIPAGTTNAFFQVESCKDSSQSGRVCTPNLFRKYTLVTTSSPSIAASPSSTITTEGTSSETIAVTQGNGTTGSGSPFAGIVVTASCSTQNGAAASVSPTSATTDANGGASFQITTSGLRYVVPGPAPSGSCTFTAAGSSHDAVIAIQGSFVSSTVSVSPSQLTHTGSQSVTATMSTSVPGTTISAICYQSSYAVTVTPASATADSTGKATFTVNPTSLYTYDPSGTIPNAPYCTFQLGAIGGSGNNTNLQLKAGNACNFNLMPSPPQCG